jgi:hypothetical protein
MINQCIIDWIGIGNALAPQFLNGNANRFEETIKFYFNLEEAINDGMGINAACRT